MIYGPCRLRGCKNRPALFPGRMSEKATEPGFVYFCLSIVFFSLCCWGYWRQWADERFGDPPPPRWIQEPSVVRDKDGRPQEDPLAVHCFCVCNGSVLLGDLFGVSRSRERDLLSVLFIYPRFLCVSINQFNSNLPAREPDSKWYAVELIDKNSKRNKQCAYNVNRCWERCAESVRSHYVAW